MKSNYPHDQTVNLSRHPRGWCGLKLILVVMMVLYRRRHPRGWCGLKWPWRPGKKPLKSRHPRGWCGLKCMVDSGRRLPDGSPPARVVWIEILFTSKKRSIRTCRHPRGWCGLKLTQLAGKNKATGRHPRGWCGLKSLISPASSPGSWSPPARVVWIEMRGRSHNQQRQPVATREGGVG